MNEKKGKLIYQACTIIRLTYKHINKLRDSITDLLFDYDSSMKFQEEYSYGTTSLHLKANHSFFYRRVTEELKEEDINELRLLVIMCIFLNEWYINRISLKDQPELWAMLFNIKNKKGEYNKLHVLEHFRLRNRKYFTNGQVAIGGQLFNYHWIDDKTSREGKEEWIGRFVGYPLVEITDRKTIKEKILERLFNED